MAIADARSLVGPKFIIGISAESLADAVRAEAEGADYIGISPVFATATKKDTAAPLGLEGIRRIRASVELPLVAIGGLSATNAGEVMAAGADGIAVVSALMAAADPREAARALRRAIAGHVQRP